MINLTFSSFCLSCHSHLYHPGGSKTVFRVLNLLPKLQKRRIHDVNLLHIYFPVIPVCLNLEHLNQKQTGNHQRQNGNRKKSRKKLPLK